MNFQNLFLEWRLRWETMITGSSCWRDTRSTNRCTVLSPSIEFGTVRSTKTIYTRVAMQIYWEAKHTINTNGLPTSSCSRQTSQWRRHMKRGGTFYTYAHICYPFVEFRSPLTLAYHAIGLFTTQMTTNSGAMRLIKVLIKRYNNALWIRRICTTIQQPLIDNAVALRVFSLIDWAKCASSSDWAR